MGNSPRMRLFLDVYSLPNDSLARFTGLIFLFITQAHDLRVAGSNVVERGGPMQKARLIKRTEQIKQELAQQPVSTPRRSSVISTQNTLTQWVSTYRNSRAPNARAAFAALFAAGN